MMDNNTLALLLLVVAFSATMLNMALTLLQSDPWWRTRAKRSSQLIMFVGFGGFVLVRFV